MEPPSKAEILREIQIIMMELFKLDASRVQPEARLVEDLELDSLDAIDLAVKVEETTGMAFDETLIRQLMTVDDVVVAVSKIVGPHGIAAFRAAAAAAPAQTES